MASNNGSDASRERTDQERERAREQRERRRLANAGAAQPVPPPLPPPLPEPTDTRESDVRPLPPVGLAGSMLPLPQSDRSKRFGAPPRRHIPHLQRARIWPIRIAAARVGVLIGLVLVALVGGAVLLFKPASHPAPPPPPKIVKVVIPEGFTRAQIAARAREHGLRGDYLAASAHSVELNPARYGAPGGTPNLEGFLFPATYELYGGTSVSRLVSEQLAAFTERFGPHEIALARTLHETPYDLLIVASMVEREAQIPGDRAKIAAVIYNRLRDGMPLGIDATIYYAVEQQRHIATYTGELTESQLHIDSPYNTRLHTGLPPTPISNPGMASIEAAAHPAHVPYLYYVAGADGCGEQAFSTTAAQFESNVAAYHAAVARAGGKPPVCKRRR